MCTSLRVVPAACLQCLHTKGLVPASRPVVCADLEGIVSKFGACTGHNVAQSISLFIDQLDAMRVDNSCVRCRLKPSGQVLVKQRKENKLSATFEGTPYEIVNKYGSEVTITSPEGVTSRKM